MLYYCKDYKNVKRDKKFLPSRFFVCFWGFVSSFLKYKKFFKLGARKFHFPKYKEHLRAGFFTFQAWKITSRNIRKFHFLKYKEFFWGFRFLKYKNRFLLRKYKKFFRGFRKYKTYSQGGFFYFSNLKSYFLKY